MIKTTIDPSLPETQVSRSAEAGAANNPAPGEYTCPMHPEVRQKAPGNCPKCGMTLERITGAAAPGRAGFTCPMHSQIVRNEPGNCPICGMTLEPRMVSAENEEENPELRDMTRRFWVSLGLTLPVLIAAMAEGL